MTCLFQTTTRNDSPDLIVVSSLQLFLHTTGYYCTCYGVQCLVLPRVLAGVNGFKMIITEQCAYINSSY